MRCAYSLITMILSKYVCKHFARCVYAEYDWRAAFANLIVRRHILRHPLVVLHLCSCMFVGESVETISQADWQIAAGCPV